MIVSRLMIVGSLMIAEALTISLETTPHTTTSPVIPAQAGILMRCKINIPVWRFTIADQVGNDDTPGGTMIVEIMMLGVQ